METVNHVLLECTTYNRERIKLIQSLKDGGVNNYSLKELLGDGINHRIQNEVFRFLNDTGLVNRM